MLGHRFSLIIITLVLTVNITSSSQIFPNFQEIFHRLKLYQSNPRVFRNNARLPIMNRIDARPPQPPMNRNEARLPQPPMKDDKAVAEPPLKGNDTILGTQTDISVSPQLSYNEKKAALKRLLLKSASKEQPADSVAPLALSLLQKLKQRPLPDDKYSTKHSTKHSSRNSSRHYAKNPSKHPSKHLTKYSSKPSGKYNDKYRKQSAVLTPEKIKSKPSDKFSPPKNLDSGFTPFFKQSKAFDDKSYLESLTTTEETTETTLGVTLSVDRATQMFGELEEVEEPKYYKVPLLRKRPVPKVSKNIVKSRSKIAPFEDFGFTKNWNFETEIKSFYDSDDNYHVTRPLEATKPTAPPVSYETVQESFDDWDRRISLNKIKDKKYTTRRSDYRGFVKNQPIKAGVTRTKNVRPKFTKVDSVEERNDEGFMESVQFTIPEEIKSFSGQDFSDFKWEREELDSGKAFEPQYDSNVRRNIERLDSTEATRNQDNHHKNKQEINSFVDDFSFSNSRNRNYFKDFEDSFPSSINFGSPWESRRYS